MSNDNVHRKLVSELISYLEDLSEIGFKEDIHVEEYYNLYGQRGFVDVLTVHHDCETIHLYEVKPRLDNLGEAIRQLNRADDVIKKGALEEICVYSRRLKTIVSLFTERNYNILKESYPILKNTDIRVMLYYEVPNEFFLINPLSFQKERIERDGDPLDWRWAMVQEASN